ncbi:MAG: hypothetical protein LBS42_08525 [Tannerella sp.]|nr:hypothetical protein [Tannerella sp.]
MLPCREMLFGKIVRIGDFGMFQTAVSSEYSETEEKLHPSFIRNPEIAFRPGTDLKEMPATLKYEKVK